jgi:hypothetical protein
MASKNVEKKVLVRSLALIKIIGENSADALENCKGSGCKVIYSMRKSLS